MLKCAQLACALALSALALRAQAVPVSTTAQTTGIVGLADAQTARLNLLNPGIMPPAVGVVCSATVAFVDANGTLLKSTTLTVAPGKSMGFDLRSDTDLALVVAGDRREIRAVIMPLFVPPPTAAGATAVAPACKLIPTLEVFDTVSGRTLVLLGHVEAIPSATANP